MTRPDTPVPVPVAVADRMAVAARAWLDTLDTDQRVLAHWPGPAAEPESEAERLRWYYTPTDHGGLAIGAQRPAQQGRAMQVVAAGTSTAGYVTVAAIMGLENVLDHVEDFAVDWGRERGRDPGLYYLRVFGEPGPVGVWGWRFGGHHVSLNVLVVDGVVRSTTPCFLGADPASSPLVGGGLLRPLGRVEDLARELVRSLSPEAAARAVLLDRAPSDIVGGNRSRIAHGDEMMALPDIWRGHFTEERLRERVTAMSATAEEASGLDAADHRLLALTDEPKGLPATALDAAQREILRGLVAAYVGRVPAGLAAPVDEDAVHFAWAGPTEPGAPHYYRLQAPRLLLEWDDTARDANHAHSVWRDPGADLGIDALAAHRAAHHR
ncbi:DUF3500 domain-containing protein [Pseudonocardia sp.]|uniref:DUF3500 domain-containing protein n=1 Tax=Pseudonocardia sp. TaxID=60912 RepID=UPI00260FBEC8|nr:DUF3500 domain-containing protein [Pseudonocardia sp.]